MKRAPQSDLPGQDLEAFFVGEVTAANLFELPLEDFRHLVKTGVFPAPMSLAGQDRWDVTALRRAAQQTAPIGLENVRWR